MYYELALISVLVAGGYWGWYFVRHDTLRTYGLMLLGAGALAGLGLLGRKYDATELGLAGAIGVGAGACLLVIGPVARGLARRAAAAERFQLAERLLDIADVLAPGSGVGDEKALLGAMREISGGNIDHTVNALEAAKARAPADARLAIDERIVMLYLSAYRWHDAIAHAEANLWQAVPPAPEMPSSPAVALRRALGIAPPVWVELLGAYGYQGDLDQAARMLARLEDVCAGREDAQIWLHRGRMMFLAHAGRVDAVQTLVEPRRSRHMSASARAYWVAVALERRGEASAAEAIYAKARARSRGRPRALIDQAIARLPEARPAELGPAASEIVARVEAAAPPAVAAAARPRGPVATRILIAAVIAAAAAISLGFGDTGDIGVLVRAGAMVRGMVRAGEWWRLVSCVFVHAGAVHLLLNVIALWFLGRLSEDLLGGWRTACVFAIAGVGGAAASFLMSPATVSVGASGAIYGLLGAAFVELTLNRRRHRALWTRGVWGSLVVVAVAELGYDFVAPMVDQWAHGAGLALGMIAGALLSPHVRWAGAGRQVARVIAIAFAAAVVFSVVMVVRTPLATSLTREPMTEQVVNGLSVSAPASWSVADDAHGQQHLADPDGLIDVVPFGAPGQPADLASWLAARPKQPHDDAPDVRIDIATRPIVALPAGWQGTELVIVVPDPLGGEQRLREIDAGRVVRGGLIEVTLSMPETLARLAPGLFTSLLGSIH